MRGVQATVHLSRSDTPDGLKRVIEGRIQALANVHRLFVESRWTGADIRPAPLFQLVMMPSRSMLTIESLLDSTMAASQREGV